MTNSSLLNNPDGYAPPFTSSTLPRWATTYRTVLLVTGSVAMAWLLVIVAGYAISLPDEAARTSGAILLLLVDVLFALAAIPYLIASAVYGVRWAVSLRGRGYTVSGLSSFFLVAAPAIVTVAIGLGAAKAMIPWSTWH